MGIKDHGNERRFLLHVDWIELYIRVRGASADLTSRSLDTVQAFKKHHLFSKRPSSLIEIVPLQLRNTPEIMPTAITPPPAVAALKDSVLFVPMKLGNITLKHRIVQVSHVVFSKRVRKHAKIMKRLPTLACVLTSSPVAFMYLALA
jgi:hypothetical protein